MQILNIIEEVENSDKFKSFRETHAEYNLAHVFRMLDKKNDDTWQLGYYSKDKDMITTFTLTNGEIAILPESEPFKPEDRSVLPLIKSDIQVDFNEAIEAAQALQKEKYDGHAPMMYIVILQNLDVGQVYNITCVTSSFKTLNIKVSSKDKEIVEHNLLSLMDFHKEPGELN